MLIIPPLSTARGLPTESDLFRFHNISVSDGEFMMDNQTGIIFLLSRISTTKTKANCAREFSNFGLFALSSFRLGAKARHREPQISLVGSLVILLNKARSEKKRKIESRWTSWKFLLFHRTMPQKHFNDSRAIVSAGARALELTSLRRWTDHSKQDYNQMKGAERNINWLDA